MVDSKHTAATVHTHHNQPGTASQFLLAESQLEGTTALIAGVEDGCRGGGTGARGIVQTEDCCILPPSPHRAARTRAVDRYSLPSAKSQHCRRDQGTAPATPNHEDHDYGYQKPKRRGWYQKNEADPEAGPICQGYLNDRRAYARLTRDRSMSSPIRDPFSGQPAPCGRPPAGPPRCQPWAGPIPLRRG